MTTLEPLDPQGLADLYATAYDLGVAVGQLSQLQQVFAKGYVEGSQQGHAVIVTMRHGEAS